MEENKPELELAAIENTKSWFTGKTITSPHLCTASDRTPCHIFKELGTCNEFLCCVRMQLKEASPGKLTLVSSYTSEYHEFHPRESHYAATLLYWLLKMHCCVDTFDVDASDVVVKYVQLIACGLEFSALKKLRIRRCIDTEQQEIIGSVLHGMSELEQLDWEEYARIHTPEYIQPLCSLIKHSSSLSSLSLPLFQFSDEVGKLLIRTLGNSLTITELVLNSSIVTPISGDNTAVFGEYLKKNKVLTKLELNNERVFTTYESSDLPGNNSELKSAVLCVSRSGSLLHVLFRNYGIDEEAASAVESYLTRNARVTWFGLKECVWYEDLSHEENRKNTSYRIEPWLSILRTNRSLQGLRLEADAFSPAEWNAFFQVLVTNNTALKQIIIDDSFGNFSKLDVPDICHNLSARNLVDSLRDLPGLLTMRCRQCYRVNISSPQHFAQSTWDKGLSIRPGDVTTKMSLNFELPGEELASLVASYIEESNVLTDLCLQFMFTLGTRGSQEASKFRKRLFSSLLRNNTVKKLRVDVPMLPDEEITLFASVLVSNRHIVELCIGMPDQLAGPFVEKLSPGFVKNFSVISFPLSRMYINEARIWIPIMEVASRNLSLVMRAAHFVAGNRDRRCAEAFEPVASSPALVDNVCQVLSVEKDEAAQKIRGSVNDLVGVSDFFLSSGVVNAELRCYESQGLQLTDVDEYSWLAVRKFLRVSDVVHDEQ